MPKLNPRQFSLQETAKVERPTVLISLSHP